MHTAQLNSLSHRVIGAAIAVHRELGPGLEEPDYETALSAELSAAGIFHGCQQALPITYKSVRLDAGFRIDMLVEDSLVLELKSVEAIHPVHEAQLLTYLRLSGRKLGLLLNFDVPILKAGIRRMVMGLDEEGAQPALAKPMDPLPPVLNPWDDLSTQVLASAIEVHRHLGPGLLQSTYEECLSHEFALRGLTFERRKPVSIRFRELELPRPAEIAFVVANELPLMIVSVAEITPLLEARLLGWLTLGKWSSGLLLNFCKRRLSQGIRRLENSRRR